MRTIPNQNTTVAVSGTEAAVLGLLLGGERSGYDLNKAAQAGVAYMWAPAKSQIYAVLPGLVRVGYATKRSLSQEQRPDKQLYRITPAGRRALKQWLEVPGPPEPSKNPFMLKVFFGRHVSRDALIELIEERRREAQAELREFKEIERRIAGSEKEFFGYLTLRWGLAYDRALIRWADQALRELRERA